MAAGTLTLIPKKSRRTKKFRTKAVSIKVKTRRNRRSRMIALTGVPTLLPAHKIVSMKYCTKSVLFPAVTTGYGLQTFALSHIKNPDITGSFTTEAPLGWSQLVQQYTRAVVLSAKVKVYLYSNGANYNISMLPNFSSSPTIVVDDIHNFMEDKRARNKRVSANDTRMGYLSATYDLAKLKGLSRAAYANDDIHHMQYGSYTYASTTPGDPVVCAETIPTSNQYVNILYQGADELASTAIRMAVEITYRVKWFRSREIYSS